MYNNTNTQKGSMPLYIALVAGFLAISLVMATFITVDEGDRAVVTTWGEVSGEMDPGMNFRVPVMQGVETYTVREQVAAFGDQKTRQPSLDFSMINAKTDGGADMKTDIAIRFGLKPDSVQNMYANVGTQEDYHDNIIRNDIQTQVRNSASGYTVNELHRQEGRESFQQDVKERLSKDFDSYGITVSEVRLENIDFDQSIEDAINSAEAKQYEIEEKRRAIEVEEAEAERKRVEAEGVRQAEEEIAQVFQGDDAYLQYLFITEALANEEATHPIYVPMDDGGMDMFKDIDNFDVEALKQAAQ